MPARKKVKRAVKVSSESLARRVRDLERRLAVVEDNLGIEEEVVAVKQPAPKKEASHVSHSKPIENLGFKVFGAAGFFLILLALFYFYRYAVDQDWLGVGARVFMGVLFSFVILGVGELFRRRTHERFSQLLMGGGVALLYLTVFATYHFGEYRAAFHMTSTLNTVLLLLVVALGVWLALRQSSQLLAAFAFLLGYVATALPASTQTFIAVIVLTLGIAYLVNRTGWQLTPYAAGAAFIVYAIAFFASKAYSVSSVAFVAACSLLVLVIVFNSLVMRLQVLAEQIMTTVTTVFFSVIFSLLLIKEFAPAFDSGFTVLYALGYVSLWHAAKKKGNAALAQTFLVTAIALFTLSVPMQLDEGWIAIVWSVEALLVLYLGSRYNNDALSILSYVLFIVATGTAAIMVFFEHYPVRTVVLLIHGIAIFLAARFDKRSAPVMVVAGTLFAVMTLSIEASDSQGLLRALSESARQVALSVTWAVLAITLLITGIREQMQILRACGIVLFSLTILKVLLVDLGDFTTVYRIVVTLVIGLLALGVSFLYVRHKDELERMLTK